MTDFTELVKLLTAMVSLLTALVGLSKALKQGSKPKKKGHRRQDDDLTLASNGSAQLSQLGLPSAPFYPPGEEFVHISKNQIAFAIEAIEVHSSSIRFRTVVI